MICSHKCLFTLVFRYIMSYRQYPFPVTETQGKGIERTLRDTFEDREEFEITRLLMYH